MILQALKTDRKYLLTADKYYHLDIGTVTEHRGEFYVTLRNDHQMQITVKLSRFYLIGANNEKIAFPNVVSDSKKQIVSNSSQRE